MVGADGQVALEGVGGGQEGGVGHDVTVGRVGWSQHHTADAGPRNTEVTAL